MAALSALLALLVALATPGLAGAEADTVRVILAWTPAMSNWGPTEANGVVVVSYAEGDVRGDFVGLQALNGEHYQLWLQNSASGATYALASFDAATAGDTTQVDAELPEAIPDSGWDYVFVSVEAGAAPAAAPGERRFLVGSIAGTPAEAALVPQILPETGSAPSLGAAGVGALLGVNVLLPAAWLGGRRRRSRARRRGWESA